MRKHESLFVEPIFNYGILKKAKLLGAVTKNQYIRRNLLKRRASRDGQFADLKEGLAEKRWWCFCWGLIAHCTLCKEFIKFK